MEPSPNLIAGQLKALADSANVESVKIPGYWHDKKGLDTEINAAPSSGEKVIYYIHGGGFVAYSAHPHDLLASIPKVLVECHPSIKRAFVIEYRLTSALPNDFTNPFPAALLDVLAGYSYLINEVGFSPKDIIVAGDSAGGNLALALARYLAEGLTLPESIPAPPGALILVSPWADIGTSHSLPGSSLETCLASDILTSLDKGLLFNARTNYCGTLGFPSAANTNPYLSPGSVHPEMSPVSFKGFPKTFIISGDAEIFIDQLRDLSRRMKGDLGDDMVYYHEEPDAVHDYIGLDAFQQEGLSTRAKLGTWLLGVFPSGGP